MAPGVAPEPNCATQICCKTGSTYLPYLNITGYLSISSGSHNLTAWYKLKDIPDATQGKLYPMHKQNNNGLDPKKCYNTRDLEPAKYWCTHSITHNTTSIHYTELFFNLTAPPGKISKPKIFIWTSRREGTYCVGQCQSSRIDYTSPQNCSWTAHHCFNLTTCGYHKPNRCPTVYPAPPGGLIKGNLNKTLIHDVNLVMAHVTYNISNLLPLYLKHCNGEDKTYTWLQTRLEDLVSDYKSRLAIQVSYKRPKRDLVADITGLFGSGNSIINSYRIAGQSQYTTWVANQVATGVQHLSNSNENLIKAVKSEAQTLLTISEALFNQTQFLERDIACRAYAQDLFTAARQEILDLRLRKTPRHALKDLIGKLELEKWLKSDIRGTLKYSELLTSLMMHTGTECVGCIGFFVTFPLSNPDQVYPNSTTIRSLGTVMKDQVIKWDHRMGYMTLRGTETLFTTRPCCHETTHHIICTCNTLQPFSHNDTKLINIHSLHGHAEAVQVSHTQWCVVSEMDSFSYGGLTCPANHTFCLEVTEDFTMGHINILGRVPLDVDVSPWWDDTFYEEGTRTMADTMDLVQQVIRQIDYHLHQAQVQANLAKKTVHILTSASTRSAQYIYSWWDWMFRICVIASGCIFIITILQFCYLRHHIQVLKTSTKNAFILSPLQVQPVQRLETSET
ncbi:uncharacterized protein LOC125715601 [Brienomyrus brachyistius]|uniref:uncharacterized protein LOC125715601 n=1 Tax=Brienomyrus brachyistius TaxID=42636 RepID=UPI0020B1C950|nr:uncharacterized protein LOC125715601 [Brienomyrus brachyistius]